MGQSAVVLSPFRLKEKSINIGGEQSIVLVKCYILKKTSLAVLFEQSSVGKLPSLAEQALKLRGFSLS